MGKALVDYLSGAIQGGQADNATLVYGGNPHLFPYKHNEGQFRFWCRYATPPMPSSRTGPR